MNDQADNGVYGPVGDANSLSPRVSQVPQDMRKDQEDTERRNSLKQEEDGAKDHLGGGDIYSPHEKAQSSPSTEEQDPSDTLEDKMQSEDEDIEGEKPQHGSEKDKDENHLDDVTSLGCGVTLSQVNPEIKHSHKESAKDKHPERRSSMQQEEDDTEAESPSPVVGLDISNIKRYIVAAFVLIVAILAGYWISKSGSPPEQNEFNLTHVFHQEMDKVQLSFPSQPSELWRRSRIHLRRHLQMTHPTEPVSLLLTSGRGAEKTLSCLAQRLAAAFSTALNASVLDIDGTSKTEQDPEQVKLDIDLALKEAFEGGKRSAVIHRFEELPPGSTLIFYRYCDHENAVFKKVFLTFTVLLEKLELSPNISLGLVEEIVQDYLKDKFISSDGTAMFNQMDVDKLSGLWSRISHVILPVVPEHTIEQQGC
ncbi:torsin-1A-interacting protein 2-like isoform X2 [Brachyhypopomus gauderio]|uniref:torsin-1A-interacting protein 2-like isoform X2 n=1 Tax=Brachyhypopomus gauderio TaxID=698409 RepID=UPI00404126E6